MTGPHQTIWRSMLFVPAHVGKYVEAAHTRGADAYILDLEDSVPSSKKASARDSIRHAARIVSKRAQQQ
jgi:citrate lyase subunit beta/citryl-CoA lyase